MKKVLVAVLSIILALELSVPSYALDIMPKKEEVVYGLLSTNGSVKNIYVVSIFDKGEIIDYGNYSKIINMTTSDKLNINGDKITVNTAAKKLYYQGNLVSKELPWNISLKYMIDGKEISGTELAGKSGFLKIMMSIKQNPEVNSTFFNNYALQIAILLDTKLCDNIKADNATILDAGGKKQITYIVLPGKGADISVTADVHDFEMDSVTINGIKLYLDMSIDTDKFTQEISKLSDAIKKLDDGSGSLLYGVNQLSNGIKKYTEGLKAFNEGLSEFNDGTNKLSAGADNLEKGLSELSKQNDALEKGALSMQQYVFDTINLKLSEKGLKIPALTPDNYSMILSDIPELVSVKKQLDSIVEYTRGLKGYMNGVTKLNAGAVDLAKGLSQLNASSSKISYASEELYNSMSEINLAAKKLQKGIASYKEGTADLRRRTFNIDNEINKIIDETIDDILGSDSKAVSFVSEKNTNVSSVQFVLKTDGIKLSKTKKTFKKSKTLSFYQRLLKLFGLYKTEY
ncbi:X-X-X-Leu-X-X-Gly heptad repeat-containing protein [Caloramator quimbayensis]|uniref:X-X-X-Leu-X-X-Gly heptad repeat-containing protein n=1 Tax=Caloramator quimbayensis TaxID=1147123 RepID=A0A1T4X5Z2_9CLOT|nr:hypothetical protein [Caloramator quimbayensis]SKA84475.1 X-X-X-Leu-X-X-Gly heptad repeat-containing protein [Caloramator quimbayensis]